MMCAIRLPAAPAPQGKPHWALGEPSGHGVLQVCGLDDAGRCWAMGEAGLPSSLPLPKAFQDACCAPSRL